MKLFNSVKNLFQDAKHFEKTDNFYYQTHICEKTGNCIKVQMDFKLISDLSGELVKLGICPECQTVFYHESFGEK